MSLKSLEIGKRALLAQRFGLDVTSNNIANVNTPGYSRRTALISESAHNRLNGHALGGGAQIEGLKNYRQQFYDREIRSNQSRLSSYDTNVEFFQRIEAVLAEPSSLGLNEQVNNFFTAFDELTMQPESTGMRQYILSQAETLAGRFNTTASQLQDARRDASDSIRMNVSDANQLIERIASLNIEIANSKVSLSTEAQSLVDERELRLEELSQIMDIKVTESSNKSVNVHSNGINIITGSNFSEVILTENVHTATGERTMGIAKKDLNSGTRTAIEIQSGKLSSLLNMHNVILDNADSSGEFSVAKQLDEFTEALVTKVNNLVSSGYGMDDTAAVSPGRNFFDPAGTSAFTIKVSEDIRSNPRDIPLADRPGEPGNANIAAKIAKLSQDANFINGETASQFYSGFLGRIGNLAEDAISGQDTTRLVNDQLENLRESKMGVNLDEEAVNLVKFQRAFEAASRVVNTVNEMLVTIVNLGR